MQLNTYHLSMFIFSIIWAILHLCAEIKEQGYVSKNPFRHQRLASLR